MRCILNEAFPSRRQRLSAQHMAAAHYDRLDVDLSMGDISLKDGDTSLCVNQEQAGTSVNMCCLGAMTPSMVSGAADKSDRRDQLRVQPAMGREEAVGQAS